MANVPTLVILHCSDTPDYSDDDPRFDKIGRSQIDEWHKDRGWKGVGYHHIIRRTGVIEVGRPETEIGAHVKGHNTNSLGVCMVGRGEFTDAQKIALAALFSAIGGRWNIPVEQWFAHYQFDDMKTCPNVAVERFRQWLTNPLS